MAPATRLGTKDRPLTVAIVGSGPAGFYAAQAILGQSAHHARVDVFERLPTPYGLVRGGVAPDHQSVKSIARLYEKIARTEGFRFFGHVEVGRALPVNVLRAHYDAIVYAVGNEASRRLGIPGEGLTNAIQGTVFVGWYNGHPDYRDAAVDLSARTAVVVGNGNVAIDIARILARQPEELVETDIAAHALLALRASRIERVILLGRRGPVQAAFTPTELRELADLRGVNLVVAPEELALDDASRDELGSHPEARKNLALLEECARRPRDPANRRELVLRFLASPVEVYGDRQERVRGLRIERNGLARTAEGSARAVGTGAFETLDAELLLPAIGFEGRPIEGVPFDFARGRIANRDGRVLDAEREVVGEYVVGWARSGAQGLIGTHRKASAEVVLRLFEDLEAGRIPCRDLAPRASIHAALEAHGIGPVSFTDWKILDQIEVDRGLRRQAPREKITDIDEMLRLLREQATRGR